MKNKMATAASALLVVLIGGACAAARGAQPPERRAWRILEAGLADKSFVRRVDALRALGFLPGDPEALRMARQALKDPRPEVRAAAASALGQMVSTDSIPQLKHMLRDPDPSVVIAATNALWKLKDPTAYEVYYEILTGERKAGEGLTTQAMEMLHDPRKLATIGIEQGIGFVPYLNIGYSAVRFLRTNAASSARAAALRALEGDPDPQTGRALVRASNDKSPIVRMAALGVIAERGNPDLLKGIVPALWDDNTAVRDVAAAAVIRLRTIAKSIGAAEGS
jgi:HEAT repeat protein